MPPFLKWHKRYFQEFLVNGGGREAVRFKHARMQSSRLRGYKATRLWLQSSRLQGREVWMILGYKPARVWVYKAATFQHSWRRGCAAVRLSSELPLGQWALQTKINSSHLDQKIRTLFWFGKFVMVQKKECLSLLWDRTHLIPLRIAKTLNSLKNNDNSVPYLCYRILMMKKIWMHQNPCENDSDVCLYSCWHWSRKEL